MIIRNTHWLTALSLLLSLSLALPYCCHTDISEVFSYHQEMTSHGQHSDSESGQCDCGHEFVKDFQKTKKVVSNPILSFSSVAVLQDLVSLPLRLDFISNPQVRPGIRNNSSPPLYLLNSVFLN